MTIEENLNLWKTFDEETRKELDLIIDQKEIEDRFYKDLAFGTGGLRGVMGAGANRMNKYTVGKATFGIANYLKAEVNGDLSVVIAYDSRNNSKEFAVISANIFAKLNIKVYLFENLVPVPILSFATQFLNCSAGVMITASHNPKEYNGYKVYNNLGCQLCPDEANLAISYINNIKDYSSIPFDENNSLIKYVGSEIIEEYIKAVEKQSLFIERTDLSVVYTPIHGTGNLPVRRVLKDSNINVSIVKSQELPDGNFSTVRSPNPEEKDALTIAIEQAKEEDADLVIGTDPDCDRVGIAVKQGNDFVLLTGNQTGALLVNFVLKMKKGNLNPKSTLIKTIVTSELGADIARKYNLIVLETLTGFKFIGEKICQFEESNSNEFVIGYEESYGYLVGTHARDKDAVVSAMLISQMAAYYKKQGQTLVDVLNEIYEEYGYYLDNLDSFVLKGKDGAEKIQNLMVTFRDKGKVLFDDVAEIIDFSKGYKDLPKENVLKFVLGDGSWIAVRPSGTEPKIKVYYSISDPLKSNAEKRLEKIKSVIKEIIK